MIKLKSMTLINPLKKSLSSVPSSFVRAYKTSASTDRVEKRVNCSASILPMLRFITSPQVGVLSLVSRGGMT